MPSRNLTKLLGLVVLAIGVVAMSSSAAQAHWVLLLNKAVSAGATLNLTLTQVGSGFIIAENGLKLECKGGSGTATATMAEENKKITGSTNTTFTGCVWVGSEKTCIINDGGKGLIKAKGTGEIIMEGTNYIVKAESAAFATIKTEGELCTIPEKEVISGGIHTLYLEALVDATTKLTHVLNLTTKLGNSKVKEISILLEIKDENPSATLAFHLEKLTGCETIC